jgi:hypothetical protein
MMKNFRKFFATTVLTLVVAFPAFAGEILLPGVIDQPPPPPQSAVTGNIQTPGVSALDPVTETALSLLQSILSIF